MYLSTCLYNNSSVVMFHVCNVDLTLLIIIDQETPNNRIVSLLFFEADIISLFIILLDFLPVNDTVGCVLYVLC